MPDHSTPRSILSAGFDTQTGGLTPILADVSGRANCGKALIGASLSAHSSPRPLPTRGFSLFHADLRCLEEGACAYDRHALSGTRVWQDREGGHLQLTQQQLDFFDAFGFLVFRQLLEPAEMKRYLEEFEVGLDSWHNAGRQ